MTDTSPALPLTRQAVAVRGRSAAGRVTGKLKRALDAMVWQGSRRTDAAAAAGLADHSLRQALRKPHVKAYYLRELEVLRTSERARNILALVDVRDTAENGMARVGAVKALEALEDQPQQRSGGAQSAPGLVVVIQGDATLRTVDGTWNDGNSQQDQGQAFPTSGNATREET